MRRGGRPSSGLQLLAALGMAAAVLLAIGGLIGVLGSVAALGSGGPPTCDGHVMSRGDSCQEYADGAYQGSTGYDEAVRNQRNARHQAPIWLGLGVGALAVGGTGIVLLARVVRRWQVS